MRHIHTGCDEPTSAKVHSAGANARRMVCIARTISSRSAGESALRASASRACAYRFAEPCADFPCPVSFKTTQRLSLDEVSRITSPRFTSVSIILDTVGSVRPMRSATCDSDTPSRRYRNPMARNCGTDRPAGRRLRISERTVRMTTGTVASTCAAQ